MWDRLIGFGKLLLSFIAPAKTFTQKGLAGGIPPAVRWILHIILVLLFFAALYWINLELRKLPRFQDYIIPGLESLERWWLPVLGLIWYAACWLAWLIWRLATAGTSEGNYPRIDHAWAEACQALQEARIPLDTPLFLILGRPEAPEQALFQAARLDLTVRQTPADTLAPIHVYANRDAIFVTCARSSLLGQHAASLALEGLTDVAPEAGGAEDDKTQVPKDRERREIQKMQLFKGQGGATGKPLERRQVRRALGLTTPNLLHKSDDVARLSGALEYLCRLIVRDRHPFEPLNGILVLVPLGGTDTPRDAQLTAEVLQRDLAIVRRVTQLYCPLFAVLCDVESLPGFSDFLRRQGNRASRVGQRFPLESPDLRGEALFGALEKAIQGYCLRGLRELVYPLFDVKQAGEGDAVNRNLFLFLNQMRERADQLSHILVHGIRRPDDGPILFGGCYLVATGTSDDEQGYVKGVLTRLIDSFKFVRWSDDALRDDAKYHGRATLGNWILGVLVVGTLAGTAAYIYKLWQR
jgi:IcmF-related N-terminal domain